MTVSNLAPLPRYADAARATRHVFIRDLMLDSYIGIYDHEKQSPQKIRVNIDLSVIEGPTGLQDNIDNVVCYEKIAKDIEAIVAAGHVHLVETLAENIASMSLQDDRISCVRVRVEKLEAIKNTTSVGIEIERSRA
ncbi:dihydroneopterin aldolase [Paremcibacter congregatus]|tara:strand:+ start:1235 stop:1642 length:408 start_codon:yes stop_codon:yes gene_type:complete